VSELIRVLTDEEADHKYGGCCWTWRNADPTSCVRRPEFRLATPHGHMDFCREHIDYALASLPPEWIEGWAYREPEPVTETSDDIPF
jgi:hypothetical protein